MKQRQLGHSDIKVSKICLGTMTWGTQNSESQAHEQMSYALERDINFFDTAEIYPVTPIGASTQGKTEEYIGTWFQKTGQRDKIVLATKVMGRSPALLPENKERATSPGITWIRDGKAIHNKQNITKALEDSLKRLKTDYIDLYQLHWPDRPANRFGIRDFYHRYDDMAPTGDYDDLFLEAAHTMNTLIQSGEIRTWGLSNETPWGVMKYLRLCDENNLVRPVSIQNPYSLLDRIYDIGLAEVSMRENIGLLAYSPLGAGVLTGKYLDDTYPEGSRLAISEGRSRYKNPQCDKAVANYVRLAKDHNIDPTIMALSFVNDRPWTTSNIIGATTMAQLKTNIDSAEICLSDDIIQAINDIHANNPNPGP